MSECAISVWKSQGDSLAPIVNRAEPLQLYLRGTVSIRNLIQGEIAMSRITSFATAAALCLLAFCCVLAAWQDADPGHAKQIQGDWKVTKMSRDGEPAPQKIIDAAGYRIGDGRLDPTVNGNVRKDSTVLFKLDDRAHPKQIDLVEKDSGETSLGIYELAGDQLKICFFSSRTMRPTSFQSTPEKPTKILIVLERIK
jgi:uncharacterized protein (TIGR03067 family)